MNLLADEPDGRDSSIVARIVTQFEDAWRAGGRPRIEDYLQLGSNESTGLLIELLHTDLEFRIKAGEEARVEEYLTRFPGIVGNEPAVIDLIEREFELSRRHHRASAEQFVLRFPQYRQPLQQRLSLSPILARWPTKCPHCAQPIEDAAAEGDSCLKCPACGGMLRVDSNADPANAGEDLPRLGKYELLKPVGQGAFSTVYRGFDRELDRVVAIKVPRNGQLVTSEDEQRFLREGRVLAQLRHPGIVPVLDVGRSSALPFLISEFVEGTTLAGALKCRRFTQREAASMVAQIADALDYSHRKGVIHRDLKPTNIMLESLETGSTELSLETVRSASNSAPNGIRPRIMDFGLARRDVGELTVTLEGQILGTPAYMSPEQARGESHGVDCRADIYSLGVILYELLVGRLPFRGNSRMLINQLLYEEPRRLRQIDRRIPKPLETLCAKAMAKDPDTRYHTAADLAADLRHWLAGEPIGARSPGLLRKVGVRLRRDPVKASLSFMLFLVGGALLWTVFSNGGNPWRMAFGDPDPATASPQHSGPQSENPSSHQPLNREEHSEPSGKEQWRNRLSEEDSQQVNTLHQAVNRHRLQGEWSEAREAQERALSIRREAQGAEYWQTVNAVRELETLNAIIALPLSAQQEIRDAMEAGLQAGQCQQQGDWAGAIEHNQRQLQVLYKYWGKTHLEIARVLSPLSVALIKSDRLEEADAFTEEALRIFRQVVGDNHHETAIAFNNRAMLLSRLERLDDAWVMLDLALRIRLDVDGPFHPYTALSYLNLGNNLQQQSVRGSGTFAETTMKKAEEMFQKSYATIQQASAADSEDVHRICSGLAKFYDETGRPERAEKYRLEAEKALSMAAEAAP